MERFLSSQVEISSVCVILVQGAVVRNKVKGELILSSVRHNSTRIGHWDFCIHSFD
jgi:hypothetical protein